MDEYRAMRRAAFLRSIWWAFCRLDIQSVRAPAVLDNDHMHRKITLVFSPLPPAQKLSARRLPYRYCTALVTQLGQNRFGIFGGFLYHIFYKCRRGRTFFWLQTFFLILWVGPGTQRSTYNYQTYS